MVICAGDAGAADRAVLAAGRFGEVAGATDTVRMVEYVVVGVLEFLGGVISGSDGGGAGVREVGEGVGRGNNRWD